MNFIKALDARKLLKEHTRLPEQFSPVSFYCGFDATAASLHVGHLPALLSLVLGGSLGLQPIALIGTATALIGDPSGRTQARPLLLADQVAVNKASLAQQMREVYAKLAEQAIAHNFCGDVKDVLVLDNYEFYRGMGVIEFLREVGTCFPVRPLLNREFVQSREESISYSEFSYSLLQAFDFYRLYEEHQCSLQIGGSDQWSNIVAGTELVRKKCNASVVGATLPLLTTKAGVKFGKTAGNAVFLDSKLTSSYDIYQYCYNLGDSEIEDLVTRLTFLPAARIQTLSQQPLEARALQKALAEELISTAHSHEAFERAKELSEALFSHQYSTVNHSQLTATELLDCFKHAECLEVSPTDMHQTVVSVCKQHKVLRSNTEARQFLKEGALRVNGQAVSESTLLSEVTPIVLFT